MELGLFTPDSKQIVGHHSGRKAISFFDVTSGQPVRTWELSEAVVGLAIAPDGKQVVSSHPDKVLRLWDFQTGQEIRTLEGSLRAAILAFSPYSKQVLAASSKDKTIRLWDVETGRLVRTFEHFLDATPFQGHDLIVAAFFLPGGGQMAGYVWGKERTLLVWDVADGKVVREFDLGSDHHKDLAISPDGRWFLTAHEGRPATVRLRDLLTGEEVDRFALATCGTAARTQLLSGRAFRGFGQLSGLGVSLAIRRVTVPGPLGRPSPGTARAASRSDSASGKRSSGSRARQRSTISVSGAGKVRFTRADGHRIFFQHLEDFQFHPFREVIHIASSQQVVERGPPRNRDRLRAARRGSA